MSKKKLALSIAALVTFGCSVALALFLFDGRAPRIKSNNTTSSAGEYETSYLENREPFFVVLRFVANSTRGDIDEARKELLDEREINAISSIYDGPIEESDEEIEQASKAMAAIFFDEKAVDVCVNSSFSFEENDGIFMDTGAFTARVLGQGGSVITIPVYYRSRIFSEDSSVGKVLYVSVVKLSPDSEWKVASAASGV